MNMGMLLLSITLLRLVIIQFTPIVSPLPMVNTGISDKGTIMTGDDNTKALTKGIILEAFIGLVWVQNFTILRGEKMFRRYIIDNLTYRGNNKVR